MTKYHIAKALKEDYKGPYNPPYVVYGTGRSGTSFICRILHDHFGVHLGNDFEPMVPGFRDEPPYECLEYRTLTWGFLDGKIDFPTFLQGLYAYWARKATNHKKWGIKDLGTLLRICYFYLPHWPRLIVTFRDYNKVRESMVRVRKWQGEYIESKEHAEVVADWRITQDKNLKAILPKDMYLPIYIHKDRRTTEEEVIHAIEKRWPDIND